MTLFVIDMALLGVTALGGLLGCLLPVRAFMIVLVGAIALWIVAARINGLAYGTVILATLCVAVAAQIGYGSALVGRALLGTWWHRKVERRAGRD